MLAEARLDGARLGRGDDPEVALDAEHLVVDGSVAGSGGFTTSGTVSMAGARVNGSVRLDGATITAGGGRKVAFDGDGMTVGHDFNANGLRADGEMRLVDVTVASTLELRGAALANPGGVARLDRAEISGSLYCDKGFTAAGEVCAIGAHVKGSVYLNDAALGTPAGSAGTTRQTGTALRLVRSKIDSDLGCWEGFAAHGTVDLARSSVAGEFRLATTGLDGHPKAADLTNCQFATVALSGDPPAGYLDFTKAKADFFRDGAAYWQSARHRPRRVRVRRDRRRGAVARVGGPALAAGHQRRLVLEPLEGGRRRASADHEAAAPGEPEDQHLGLGIRGAAAVIDDVHLDREEAGARVGVTARHAVRTAAAGHRARRRRAAVAPVDGRGVWHHERLKGGSRR